MIKQINRSILAAAAAFLLGATPSLADEFSAVVAKILQSQTDSRIASLDAGRKQAMITCVNGVVAKLPAGKKRFVLAGASFDEQQDRFGKVVQENRAEWEQKIAAGCSSIVVGRGGIGHN